MPTPFNSALRHVLRDLRGAAARSPRLDPRKKPSEQSSADADGTEELECP
ncbi:hypothetical protein XCR_3962 [Xanthomonas campestris pv. raphani 756C]|nr:hypothetical protein XCR_3962 [Xanthomonas campestris pv. raphani 756C]